MDDKASRSIPAWLAPIVQDLELRGRTLVSIDDMQEARPELDRRVIRAGVTQLVKRGWLHSTDVPGIYEFIAGAAAGPYPSGDPWLPLRAVLARHPGRFHAGATSAAWLLGYAQRSPEPHIVVTQERHPIPRALRAAYRVLETNPAPAHGSVDDVPVPTPPELFVEVAQLAPRLPLDSARGWLRRLLEDTAPEVIVHTLQDRGPATRARAGYLADICGAEDHAAAISPLLGSARGPFYTGPRDDRGPFSPRWHVYDTGHIGSP